MVKYYLIFIIGVICSTCKKKTNIEVRTYNYALDELVTDARVVLIERKLSTFGSDYSCKVIEEKMTDANGKCSFDGERLKTNSSYQYFIDISGAYGLESTPVCGGKTFGFLDVGKSQKQELNVDFFEGYFQVQYNNLLQPSQPGDSMWVYFNTIEYSDANGKVSQGAGGIFAAVQHYTSTNPAPTYANPLLTEKIKTKGQRLKRFVRKRKMGVVTQVIDTIKIFPNKTTTVVLDW